MKIRSLRLEHFRKFTDPIVLAGLTDGVNVLAEGNEFGKSTLLAAIRGVLFERHVSRAASVVQMQHWANKTSPVIALEFELPSGLHRIEKRFLHKEPFARLTLPNGTMHHGEAAEEHLQAVLNFTQAGKSGSKPDNVGMWAALWVTQKDSADQPGLSDSARQTIHGCLDQEVGALAGGTRGSKLIASVRADLGKIRDGNKKPAGRHKEAVANLATSQTKVAELQARQARLLKDIEELERVKRKLADVGESSEESKTGELLSKARLDRESAQRYEEQLRTAIATQRGYQGDLASAAQEVEVRKQQDDALAGLADKVQTLTEAETASNIDLQHAEAALKGQRDRVRDASGEFEKARETLRKAKSVAGLALIAGNLQIYRERLLVAEDTQTHINSLVARLSSLSITEDDMVRIRTLEQRLRRTEAVLEARATRVLFNLFPDNIGLVKINGEALTTASQSLIDETAISIEGIGEIVVQPAIQDRETLLSQQGREQRELREALQSVSASSVDQAEEICADRKQCEAELTRARQDLVGHTPADLSQKLGAGVEALRNHISVLEARLNAGLQESPLTSLPPLQDAQVALQEAEQQEGHASESVALARAPLAGFEDHHAEMIRVHARIAAEKAGALDEQSRVFAARDLRLQQESPEALAERLNSSTVALKAQQALIESMELARPPDTVATLDTRIARYGTALANYAKERQATRERQAVLQNQIVREEGVGIEEKVAAAQQEVDSLGRECARYQHEIKVLELLLESLEQAEKEAKERYMAPVVQRITPYLQTLFPGAAIHCDDEFNITGIIRELQQTESFDVLSVGTQEQIAVLTRLAFADMLLERGKPATVILDDALVYSDTERMERMFDLLTHAAQRTQILILTCREDLFTRLGGTRLRVTTG
jgi:AAA domain